MTDYAAVRPVMFRHECKDEDGEIRACMGSTLARNPESIQWSRGFMGRVTQCPTCHEKLPPTIKDLAGRRAAKA